MDELTKDAFAQMVLDRLQQAGETQAVTYDPEAFSLQGEGERSSLLYLSNFYQEYCSATAEGREQVVKRGVRAWFGSRREIPDEFGDVKPDLLPALRARGFFEAARLQVELAPKSSAICPYQVLGEHFGVGIVYDLPESMALVSEDLLDSWGATFEEALEVALANLRELPMQFLAPQSGKGSYVSATKDGYDASRLLLSDLVRQFEVRGEIIAMVPNREDLLITGSEDEDGLRGMLALAEEALKKPRPVLGIALRLDGEDWTPWLPDESHPLYEPYHELFLQSLGEEYAGQKELLDGLLEKGGEDIFVANYGSLKTPAGRMYSYSVWGEGIDTLLPEAELIAFMTQGKVAQLAERHRVVEVVGDLMEQTDMYPVRYRVREFPSEEQRAAMGNLLG